MFRFLSSAPDIEKDTQSHDFSYLSPEDHYFDSACQTLRPIAVQLAEQQYYQEFNACGGRVKYKWGEQTDRKVQEARKELLKLAGKTEKEYTVVFTLNTTYGINLLLQQLRGSDFSAIITTDKEHNSVFLPSMSWATRNQKERIVLERKRNGGVELNELPKIPSVFLVNCVSNIDGQVFPNLSEVTHTIHRHGGIVLLDGAQAFSSHAEMLRDIDFDAVFGSGHKMYGPSIGFIILRKSLLTKLDLFFIGGGTVSDVERDTYTLMSQEDELYALLEPGLQNWAGIIGLLEAVRWKKSFRQDTPLEVLSEEMYTYLASEKRVHLINTAATPTISFYVDGIDSHQLSLYLAEKNIMCRSGYFCCHYYLKNKLKLPPLLRVSLGLHTTKEDIHSFKEALSFILNHF